MGFIIILPFAALGTWSIFAIFRWLRRGRYEKKWWRAFAILSLVGFLLGNWSAFSFKYQVSKVRLQGFPIPTSIASRETPADKWLKSDMPFSIRLGSALTDVLTGMALCLAPIAVAAFFRENRAKHPQFEPRVPTPP